MLNSGSVDCNERCTYVALIIHWADCTVAVSFFLDTHVNGNVTLWVQTLFNSTKKRCENKNEDFENEDKSHGGVCVTNYNTILLCLKVIHSY
jgi:hypothetical protein